MTQKYWKVDWNHYNSRINGRTEVAYKFIKLISKKSNTPSSYSYFTTDRIINLAASIGVELTRKEVNEAMQYGGSFGRIEGVKDAAIEWSEYDIEWRGIELKKDIEW